MASRRFESPQLGGDLASSAARVKRFHSKSRRGCLTCRQRRVKCGEERTPNCARCDKGGYNCEWQDTRQGRPYFTDDRQSTTTTRSHSQATTFSEDDFGFHQFFADGIVTHVTHLFRDMATSFATDVIQSARVSSAVHDFYAHFVLHSSHTSAIIRKTLTALSGLYERANASFHASSPQSHDYIARYSEAVTELRLSSQDLGPDVVLIASILFANCEYLIGDLCSAVRQLRAGAKVLVEHRNNADSRLSRDLGETLGIIFDVFGHEHLDLEGSTPDSNYLDTITEHQFDDLSQANDNILQICSHAFAIHKVGMSHPRHVTPIVYDFQRWFNSWKNRIMTLDYLLDTEDLPWLHLLQAQHSALSIMIQTMASTNEPGISENEQLDRVVQQVSRFLQICSAFIEDLSIIERPFKDNMGLILPLFLVVLRCAETETCEAALALLRHLNVIEGLWNSCCAYAVAKPILSARVAMRFQRTQTTYAAYDSLPIVDVRQATLLDSGTELDITITFPRVQTDFGPSQSNVIIGGFCMHEQYSGEQVCEVVQSTGYQRAVITRPLRGCHCHDSI